LRASESQAEYGVVGGGALSKSLIAGLPAKRRQIGPVVGASYRVASIMSNRLRAGHPARALEELGAVRVILFHAPSEQVRGMAEMLETADIDWKDKPLIFCDSEVPVAIMDRFRALGASTAVARQFGIPGTIMLEGAPIALACAHRLASQLKLRAVEIAFGTGFVFAAAHTLATVAITPLINRVADMLRASGLRDTDAVRIAVALFERTIQDYGHSGKQSWTWHRSEPAAEQIEAEIASVNAPFQGLFRELILAGFEDFDKHPKVAGELRRAAVRVLAAGEPG